MSEKAVGTDWKKRKIPTEEGEGKPSCGRFGTQSCPIGPNLYSNDDNSDGHS